VTGEERGILDESKNLILRGARFNSLEPFWLEITHILRD
jgi:hypothetical protein